MNPQKHVELPDQELMLLEKEREYLSKQKRPSYSIFSTQEKLASNERHYQEANNPFN